ncbi:alpha-mannosidase 2 [Condylostylus longicornis]|uniref:alpha-mannosidase 2 n=1 Tax=Condylostylus longicornis TaxID=2530218 RepID=UPI00244DE3B0|nr:alpha-mannosidase 2 [Condylostylus longicornis]
MVFKFRRRITLVLCAACIILCLFLYILINFSVPTIKQPDNDINLEQTEYKDFMQQALKRNEFDDNGKLVIEEPNFIDHESNVKQKFLNNNAFLNKKEMFHEMIIDVKDFSKCPINTEIVPKPDIQMLDVYQEVPFDNPDGGVWKQGWKVEYDPKQFNRHHKLKVFVVPHSHNDPGWLKTFDDYFEYTTKQILSNAVRHLTENSDMRFIWAEISYFSRFYERISEVSKLQVKKLVKNRQLEFVTGGWVMPDEANSHWLSILMQLTEGQEWLKVFLNVTPISSWSIDPFGQSPTMPFILKNSGFENLLIQRTHYSVKKRLAKEKQLEFRWRQIWDDSGETDLLTHMMPFYSYDIPHTCGPDPKICCQFDFKRLPRFGIQCPWNAAPQQINDLNIVERANLIVDQWRKKSVLYKTRSVLIPLGDDFRYSQSTEWKAQRENYEKLFDYINGDPNMFVEAKFATLQDYFDSLRKERNENEFPSLSGDFFTYADRDDHYWSGYYTSRPYHKRMDRVLLHYIRSAEMLRSWLSWESQSKMDELLQNARRQLSLFQHHDGITGTAKDFVVEDYAKRMQQAIKDSRHVMQQAIYKLLTNPEVYSPNYDMTYFFMDDSRWPSPDDSRTTIILGEELPTKYVVFHNSLPQWREEIVEFFVSNPYVEVTDYNMNKIPAQVSFVWCWHKGLQNSASIPQPSTTKFRLIFKVRVPPLGLITYIVHKSKRNEPNSSTTFSKNTILTTEPFTVQHGEFPNQVEFAEPREISLQLEDGPIVAFSQNGLLKSIAKDAHSTHFPTHLEFLKYVTNRRSGAYLFLPDGPATRLSIGSPTVLIQQGDLESSVSTGLPFATHSIILRNNVGSIEIRNIVDIGRMDNNEIIMRISTGIKNNEVFYTDLNGLQIIKRKRFGKLPLQANYYPVPSSIYIEDDKTRLTLLSAQPLGGSSLKSGEIEIMQDRRLAQDDNRGLGQGVLDNKPVIHIFRLLLEDRSSCNQKPHTDFPGGFLTTKSHKELETLLHPIDSFMWNENQWNGLLGIFGKKNEPLEDGIEIGVLKYISVNTIPSGSNLNGHIGIVIHRKYLDECSSGSRIGDGTVNLIRLLDLKTESKIFAAPLTLLRKEKKISNHDISLCPMDLKSFIIER